MQKVGSIVQGVGTKYLEPRSCCGRALRKSRQLRMLHHSVDHGKLRRCRHQGRGCGEPREAKHESSDARDWDHRVSERASRSLTAL